jgi:hypothetical protein
MYALEPVRGQINGEAFGPQSARHEFGQLSVILHHEQSHGGI